MIVLRLGAESLAHVRFAVSPLTETMRSVHALDDPGSRAIHLPWVTATREAVAGLDLAPLRALVPGDVYTPDFTSPPPAGPLVELEDELAAMLAVPPEQVAAEVARTYRGRPMPPALEPFVTRPERAVAGLADLVRAYWDAALAPALAADPRAPPGRRPAPRAHAGRRRRRPPVRRHGPGDRVDGRRVAHPQARRGVARPRRPRPALRAERLRLAARGRGRRPRLAADGGLSRARHRDAVGPGPTGRPAGARWRSSGRAAPPCSPPSTSRGRRPTSRRRLGVSAGGVSQHLSVLRAAGLVHGQRAGRSVLYMRSPAGDQVVEASR